VTVVALRNITQCLHFVAFLEVDLVLPPDSFLGGRRSDISLYSETTVTGLVGDSFELSPLH
jgi:hypothetical protein